MFRHQGKTRTLQHNLKVASLLSFVAGSVNVTGFLAVQRLTTNVTGHFAFFIDEAFKLHFGQAFIYLSYLLFFLAGSFCSSLLTEIILRKNEQYVYVIPVSAEIIILLLTGCFGTALIVKQPDLIACSLLFAMGLQNSLVTRISNASVRTTHLTGLFTDLGIELSQLFFYKEKENRKKLTSSIRLRLTIISFFFLGGIISGILYSNLHLYILFFAAILLAGGLVYDSIRFRLILLRRRYTAGRNNE